MQSRADYLQEKIGKSNFFWNPSIGEFYGFFIKFCELNKNTSFKVRLATLKYFNYDKELADKYIYNLTPAIGGGVDPFEVIMTLGAARTSPAISEEDKLKINHIINKGAKFFKDILEPCDIPNSERFILPSQPFFDQVLEILRPKLVEQIKSAEYSFEELINHYAIREWFVDPELSKIFINNYLPWIASMDRYKLKMPHNYCRMIQDFLLNLNSSNSDFSIDSDQRKSITSLDSFTEVLQNEDVFKNYFIQHIKNLYKKEHGKEWQPAVQEEPAQQEDMGKKDDTSTQGNAEDEELNLPETTDELYEFILELHHDHNLEINTTPKYKIYSEVNDYFASSALAQKYMFCLVGRGDLGHSPESLYNELNKLFNREILTPSKQKALQYILDNYFLYLNRLLKNESMKMNQPFLSDDSFQMILESLLDSFDYDAENYTIEEHANLSKEINLKKIYHSYFNDVHLSKIYIDYILPYNKGREEFVPLHPFDQLPQELAAALCDAVYLEDNHSSDEVYNFFLILNDPNLFKKYLIKYLTNTQKERNQKIHWKEEATAATYRVASTQTLNTLQILIKNSLASENLSPGTLKQLGTFLQSELGIGLLSTGLGYSLRNQEDPRVQQLAEEFRVDGMVRTGEAIWNRLFTEIEQELQVNQLPSEELEMEEIDLESEKVLEV